MKRINHFVPESMDQAFDALAQRTDIKKAEHQRRAFEQYLRRHKALPPK